MPNKHLTRLTRRIAVLAVALVVGISTPVWSQSAGPSSRLDPLLQVRSHQLVGRSRVIVEFNGDPDTRVVSRYRGLAIRALDGSRSMVADVDNTALAALAGESQVRHVAPDHPAFATMERTGAAIAATVARQQFSLTGRGIGVAIIDSGITAWHDDLYLSRPKSPRTDSRIVHFRDFTRQKSASIWTVDQPLDDYGHGTHVAGIIAGSGFDSGGARAGIAPGVNLVGLKVLDANGFGYISDVIAAIDYAIAIRKAYNIRVINLSVASGVFESYKTSPLALAAKRAVDAGIVVIAAAGNLGTDEAGNAQWGGITCPANAPWVLTVGASSHKGTRARSDDIVATFSSHGPTLIDHAAKPDILAPGVGIESLSDPHSTLYARYADYLLSGTRATAYKPYLSLSGTSMAAPVVAGTVALMLEANPRLTPNAVKAILEYTAEARAGESPLAQGAGMVNALGAVRMAKFFGTPDQKLPAPVDTIENEKVEWSQQIQWGNDRVAGGVLLPGANAWAVGTTWGAEATSTGQPIVWGLKRDPSVSWSTNADESIVWSVNGADCIVWSVNTSIVWSVNDGDSIVWSVNGDDSIVWSVNTSIVWSVNDGDSIVWSVNTSIVWSVGTAGQVLWPPPAEIDNRRRDVPARQ